MGILRCIFGYSGYMKDGAACTIGKISANRIPDYICCAELFLCGASGKDHAVWLGENRLRIAIDQRKCKNFEEWGIHSI